MPRRKNALELLANEHSWHLQRVSHKSVPGDILLPHRWPEKSPEHQKLTLAQQEEIIAMLKAQTCWRVRIGTGAWYYGATAEGAARLALAAPRTPRRRKVKRK